MSKNARRETLEPGILRLRGFSAEIEKAMPPLAGLFNLRYVRKIGPKV